jgi:hypothetical protein
MVFAHIGHAVEPLLFLPAFGAVIWAMVASHRNRHEEDRNA